MKPGIFMSFIPSHLDIVVDVTDPEQLPDKAKHFAERFGDKARIVKVEPIVVQAALPEGTNVSGNGEDGSDRESGSGPGDEIHPGGEEGL